MNGGFWAGSIPPWACVIGFCLILLAGSFGVWVGWGLGEEAERKAAAAELEAEQAIAAARPIMVGADRYGNVYLPAGVPAEVAHEAWLAHTDQAMHLANETHGDGPSLVELDAYGDYRDEVAPDPRTDTQWTRDMAADMDAWLAGLLGTHPVTEEL